MSDVTRKRCVPAARGKAANRFRARSTLFLPAAAAALAAAALLGCGGAKQGSRAAVDIDQGPVESVIRATGTLRARNSTKVNSELQMEAKIIFLADEGATVSKGDVLVKLDPTELEQRAEDLARQITTAVVQVEVADAELRIQQSDGKNQIAKAELQLSQAGQELEKYRDGDAPIQEKRLKVSVQEALSERDRAKVKHEQMPKLLEEGFVTASQAEEERIRLQKAEVAYESAVKEYELFEKYTRPMEIERKQNDVAQARSDLEAVKLRAESQLKQSRTVKQQHEDNLAGLKKELTEVSDKIRKTVLRAPAAGLVIYGGMSDRDWRGEEEIKVGARVWPTNTIITLPDTSEMDLVVRIHESDIGKIAAGHDGRILVESRRDASFTGKISKIADLASTGGWRSDPNVKMFEVTISVDGTNNGLKPGTSAEIHILVDRREKVTRAPVAAVHGSPGAFHCFVLKGGEVEKREVKLGLAGESMVEVAAGLEPGESVLLGSAPGEWETKGGEAQEKASGKGGKGARNSK